VPYEHCDGDRFEDGRELENDDVLFGDLDSNVLLTSIVRASGQQVRIINAKAFGQ
jgi:hypothetical protein